LAEVWHLAAVISIWWCWWYTQYWPHRLSCRVAISLETSSIYSLNLHKWII